MSTRNWPSPTYASQSRPAFLDLHVFVICWANFSNFVVNPGTFEEKFAVFKQK